MSTTVHVKPQGASSGEPPVVEPIKDSTGPRENAPDEGDLSNSDGEDDAPTINDVESLRKGIIKTSMNKAQAPYTILLVGETGTGKSSILEFIGNVLTGKDADCYDLKILDYSNEQGGSSGQSQTNLARIYELSSSNGILVRILDAPGLADTRGIDQDELHKKSIAAEILTHIASVSAVLIVANGAVPRITVGMDYALAALSAIFPKSLVNNIAFLFSNVSTPLSFNFSKDAIPEDLKNAPHFLIDNPVSLQKKYLELKDGMSKRKVREMQKAVKNAEENALEMLVDLFDWLDGLEPQSTWEMIALYEKYQAIESKITNTLAQMDQTAAKMAEIKELLEDSTKKSTVQETQVSVDDTMKKQWEAAKDEKERTEALVTASKSALDDLSHAMDEAMDELARFAEEYARLSLSGCFSAPLEKAIRLLEQRCKGMEEKGVGPEQLERMHGSLEQLKGRLDVLRMAKEKVVVTKAKQVWEKATEPMQEGARMVFEKVREWTDNN